MSTCSLTYLVSTGVIISKLFKFGDNSVGSYSFVMIF